MQLIASIGTDAIDPVTKCRTGALNILVLCDRLIPSKYRDEFTITLDVCARIAYLVRERSLGPHLILILSSFQRRLYSKLQNSEKPARFWDDVDDELAHTREKYDVTKDPKAEELASRCVHSFFPPLVFGSCFHRWFTKVLLQDISIYGPADTKQLPTTETHAEQRMSNRAVAGLPFAGVS